MLALLATVGGCGQLMGTYEELAGVKNDFVADFAGACSQLNACKYTVTIVWPLDVGRRQSSTIQPGVRNKQLNITFVMHEHERVYL